MIVTRTEVRVRYADTDQMHMVYHAKYLEYFEQGRSDLLRDLGLPYSQIEALGYHLPVVEAYAKYVRPARYDDLLVVWVMMKQLPSLKVKLEYEIRSGPGGDLVAIGHTTHTFIDSKTGAVCRIPQFFTDALEKRFNHPK